MIFAFVNPDPLLTDPDDAPSGRALGPGVLETLTRAELVPVTGRDEVGLLLVPAAFTSWQILLYGAVVVTPDGEEDPAWRRLTLETQRRHTDALVLAAQALDHVSMFGQLGLDVEVVDRGGAPLLVRATHPHDLDLALRHAETEWRAWLADSPFVTDLRLMRDGRALVLLPAELGPASAVNYVTAELGDQLHLSIGVGSAEGDRDFLALCDVALVPGPTLDRWQTPE